MFKFNFILKLFIVVALILLFGSVPMNIISKILNWIASAFSWIGNAIDFFGWGGVF